MAKNLRTKIKKDDTLFIHDVNEQVTKQFVEEFGSAGPVTAAKDVREVAENAVSRDISSMLTSHSHDELYYFLFICMI